MANVTIPNLTSATSITPSTDLLVVEQTAGTRKATPSQLFTDSATQNSGLGITSGGVYTIRKNLKDNICTDNETLNSASSKQYDAGKYFFNTGTDTLRKATSTINAGDIITSSNSSETTVADELSQINTKLSDNSTLSSGYYVAPNGLKFIWGATDNVSVSANSQGTLIQEITFPVQMSNANYRVAMSNNMGVPVIPFTYNRTTSGFKIYGGNPFASNMNATIEYIVIGY